MTTGSKIGPKSRYYGADKHTDSRCSPDQLVAILFSLPIHSTYPTQIVAEITPHIWRRERESNSKFFNPSNYSVYSRTLRNENTIDSPNNIREKKKDWDCWPMPHSKCQIMSDRYIYSSRARRKSVGHTYVSVSIHDPWVGSAFYL